jgi:hypothetical protein
VQNVGAMKTLINALLIGSLMTTVAFAGDPAPKADKTAPAKTDDKAAPAKDAKATDTKAAPAKDAKATDTKKDATKKDVKAPATK